jgi:HAE1 family hydrophobic/amphiphilic exporter-1
VVGGLCVSQLLTLYITPVVYIYMDKVESLFKGKAERAEPEGAGEGVSAAPGE